MLLSCILETIMYRTLTRDPNGLFSFQNGIIYLKYCITERLCRMKHATRIGSQSNFLLPRRHINIEKERFYSCSYIV